MNSIASRKCVQHPTREAIARCPSCHEHFCRECVVEHDGALLCAACLARLGTPAETRRRAWTRLREVAVTALGVVVMWLAFYSLGALLKAIPTTVHEGTIWAAPAQRP